MFTYEIGNDEASGREFLKAEVVYEGVGWVGMGISPTLLFVMPERQSKERLQLPVLHLMLARLLAAPKNAELLRTNQPQCQSRTSLSCLRMKLAMMKHLEGSF